MAVVYSGVWAKAVSDHLIELFVLVVSGCYGSALEAVEPVQQRPSSWPTAAEPTLPLVVLLSPAHEMA